MSAVRPTIVVIVGVTGDLSTRKLLPAIESIVRSGAVPRQLKVLGITRQSVQAAEVLGRLPANARHDFLDEQLLMHQMDLTRKEDYEQLARRLHDMERALGGAAQRLFYLSVPPQISVPIVTLLGESGLAADTDTKLLLEKPFGVDLASAEEFIGHTKRYFRENQMYRIDHYVAKEMAQQLIAFRTDASVEQAWDKGSIASIDISAYEQIGIEGRAAFYEQTGALRDFVQNHLLQLAALALMEVPPDGQVQQIPEQRLRALKHLHVPADLQVPDYATRGQYRGYRDEVGNPHSTVETYVHLHLESDDPRWQGIPIRLVTGKALNQKKNEIRITYKPKYVHTASQSGVSLSAHEWLLDGAAPVLLFTEQASDRPEPYEQVLLEAINSKRALFTSSAEVLETWRILAPVQAAWSFSDADLIMYEPGSAGPLPGR